MTEQHFAPEVFPCSDCKRALRESELVHLQPDDEGYCSRCASRPENGGFGYFSTRALRRSVCRCYQDLKGVYWHWRNAKWHGFWEAPLGPEPREWLRRSNSSLAGLKLRQVWGEEAEE